MTQSIQHLPALTALLSSSCCVVQLVLNFFSVSCAGFAVFTPYRSILTAMTILLLTYNLTTAKDKRRGLVSLIVSSGLMISPEVVKWVNQSSTVITVTTAFYYRIHLDGLGCEACANRIKNTLLAVEWISNVKTYFSNTTAIVETVQPAEYYKLVELIKSIDAKYGAQVLDSWVI